MKKLLTLALILAIAGTVHALPPIEVADGKYLRITYEGQFGFSYRDTGSGYYHDDPTYEFNFRRNRLGFIGTYNNWLSFYFQTEYIEQKMIGALSVDPSDSGRNFFVQDAQIRMTPYDFLNITVGKLKHNLTRENLEACFEPLTLDRSPFIYTPYKTSRDIGVAIWGNFLNDMLQYRVDAMDGHTNSAEDPSPASSFRYTARLQGSFFDPETGYGLAGTYLGSKRVLTVGAAYQYEPKAVYGDIADDDKVRDYSAYSFDVFYEQPTAGMGTFTISAAYLDISFDDAYKYADPGEGSYGLNGQKNGWYIKAGYLLPMDVGPGMLQFFARYDDFKFANLYNPVTDTDFYDQRVTRTALGANYYIYNQDFKLTAEYSLTDFDEEDPNDPNYRDFNTFDLYLQVRF